MRAFSSLTLNLGCLVHCSVGVAAQPALTPVTDEVLSNPPIADGLAYRANYASGGYSQLEQINRDTVHGLALAWVSSMESGSNEAAPLVHDGVLFLPHPGDVIEVLDGRYGTRLWICIEAGCGPQYDRTVRSGVG